MDMEFRRNRVTPGRLVLILILSMACVSCSHGIEVTRVTDGDKPLVGNPWNLSMTQFQVKIVRQITKCTPKPEVTVEVTVTPTKALDDQHRYVLYSSGWWGTSDITSNLAPDGTSTGLNAASADQTAAVISNTLGIITNILSFGAMGVEKREDVNPCSDTVIDAVKNLSPLEDSVKTKTQELAKVTERVNLYTTLEQTAKHYRNDLADALKKQDFIKKQLDKDTQLLKKSLKDTTSIQTVIWPLQSDQFISKDEYILDRNVLGNWGPGLDSKSNKFGIRLALYQQMSDGSWAIPKAAPSSNTKVGVPVRLAKVGRLLACIDRDCPNSLPPQWNPNTAPGIKYFDHPILQLGQMYTVPVHGGTFKAEKAVIALDANGVPTSVQVVEQSAGMVALTGVVKEVTSLPGQVREGVTKNLNAQAEQAKARAALNTARADAAISGQTSAINALISLEEAQTALQKATDALNTARAGTP